MEPRDVIALIAIVLTLITGYWALAKFIGRLFTEHLDTKFAALDQRLTRIEDSEKENGAQVSKFERDLLNLRAELPEKYVRREDYVRGQSVIEAKLDALFLRLEKVQLRDAGVKDT